MVEIAGINIHASTENCNVKRPFTWKSSIKSR